MHYLLLDFPAMQLENIETQMVSLPQIGDEIYFGSVRPQELKMTDEQWDELFTEVFVSSRHLKVTRRIFLENKGSEYTAKLILE